jgi:hypothetical protein
MPKGARPLAVDVSPTLAIKTRDCGSRASARTSPRRTSPSGPASTQQQVARVENPAASSSLKTLEKVAKALGHRLELELRAAGQ